MADEPRENASNEDMSPIPESDLPVPDNYDLLFADCRNDPEEFDRLIRHTASLNYQDDFGETALLTGIRRTDPPDIIKRLIHYGCDVNLPDKLQRTPLHLAVLEGNVDITHDLLEHGADLDVQDLIAEETPLFYAIKSDDMELACMLLCYGADVTIKNAEGHNALTYAMDNFSRDIIPILIDYYDDFNNRDKQGYMPLHLVMEYGSDLAIQLVDAGADCNGFTNDGYCALEFAMDLCGANVFKKIWSKMDVEILLETKFPLLMTYISSLWHFSTKEWVECLHLMLESSIAADLIDQCLVYCASLRTKKSFITVLVNSFREQRVASEERQNIINICLSLGAEVTVNDLDAAIREFGFKAELEPLIYATEDYRTDTLRHPLLPLVIGLSDMKLLNMILRCQEGTEPHFPWDVPKAQVISQLMVSCKGFISLPPFEKQELLRNYQRWSIYNPDFKGHVKAAWEFPSLLELSRNRVHGLVKEGRKPKKPYQFLDAIKSLPLPGAVIDLLLFKKPLYN